jgi:signal transduction histidine kinase
MIDNRYMGTPALLPLKLMSQEQWQTSIQQQRTVFVAFYAIMAALFLYNGFLFASLRQAVYGYYLLFLVFVTIQCAFIDTTAIRFIYPYDSQINVRFSYINAILASCVYLIFLWEALERIEFSRSLRNGFRVFLPISGIVLLYNFSADSFASLNILLRVYSFLVLCFCLFAIIVALRKRVPIAIYLFFAEACTFLGGSTILLVMHGVIPINSYTPWSLHIGILGEALLLSLALAAKTNIAIKEKLKAQHEAYEHERKTLEALELATKSKNQFLATVSHELRTPLNSIIGFSNVLLDSDRVDGEDREHVRTVLKNGNQLLSVINDVLNLSLIDSNQLAIKHHNVDIHDLLLQLETRYRLAAEKSHNVFELNLNKNLPMVAIIDGEHLTQILKQLVDNAFKFTHKGKVKLEVSGILTESNNPLLHFTLIDTGIGIADNALTNVFQPFTQVDSSDSRRYSGTGVGLFIAKSVSEKMGGSLEIHSTEGVGTRFDLKIPYKVEAVAHPANEKTSQTAPTPDKIKHDVVTGRVLYVEDNIDNQDLVKLLVEKRGAELILAENGQHAIETIEAAQPFDLILMDLQMPVMDGYEATQYLKGKGCHTPIIACSASALTEIESKHEGLFEGYLGKPIDKHKLFSVLEQYLRHEVP